jgi:hypothetical protein
MIPKIVSYNVRKLNEGIKVFSKIGRQISFVYRRQN